MSRKSSLAESLSRLSRRRVWQVLLSVASVVLAVVVTRLSATLVATSPFALLFAAVAFAAAVGGYRLALLMVVLAVVAAATFLLAPGGALATTAQQLAALAVFVVVALVIVAIGEFGRRSRARADESIVRLQETATELEVQQAEAQQLTEEVEQANAELQDAISDATRAREIAESGERQMRLLDEASRVLASSLDYEVTVAAAAQLAVPEFADWCSVDLLADGQIQQLAVAHVDPDKVRWARELNARYPANPGAPLGVPNVIRTGKPELHAAITDELLRQAAPTPEQLDIVRELGMQSAMIVPMKARGRILGALSLVSVNPARRFDEHDLSVAQELARRAGIAIDNAQLYRAALAANEAKSNFLATMSHELRTPLTAIIGYQELLAEGISGPVTALQAQQLQRIKVSSMHLLGLIDEILSYSRLEAGRESVRIDPVAVKGVVDDAAAFVMPLAEGKPIRVSVQQVDPGLMIRTDSGKLRQILVNLLSNAVKFTVKGIVSLRVELREPDIIFSISDTGIGIAPEHLDHIFDPFWQVEQHMTRIFGGTGLGLSVSRRLAQLLGGDITVESTPGMGSTFRVRLPLERVTPPRAVAAQRA